MAKITQNYSWIYAEYVDHCNEVGSAILSYDEWKYSEGYIGKTDPDSNLFERGY